ncbi:MAG: hypothetical protein MUF87_18040 [Anaerolineae bacterium]|jgi:hypothetical protein|nr:hypothetical protein [Anaerolineae bacterium]
MIRHEVYQEDPLIIIEYIEKNWTWEAYLIARQELHQLVQERSSPIYLIIYFENGISIPANIFTKMKKVTSNPQIERGIIVPEDATLRFVVGVLQRLNHPISHKLEFATTLDEALQRLQVHREDGNNQSSFHASR